MSETHEIVSIVHEKIMTTKYFLSIPGGFWGLCRHSAAQSVVSSQANRHRHGQAASITTSSFHGATLVQRQKISDSVVVPVR